MFQKKYYLNLSVTDYRVLLFSLVRLKNRLIHEGISSDSVDELILKVFSAPVKRI